MTERGPYYILSLDQGTTSTRAFLFDADGAPMRLRQKELSQSYPQDGWVEHDPDEIWSATLEVARGCLAHGTDAKSVAAIGITNQRETVVVWERASGRPLGPAIVWQDRRTADFCAALKAEGFEDEIRARTGLLADPYFSGTKIAWALDRYDGARAGAEKGEVCVGTVDSWLIYKLTGGRVHATDATNASRTMLFNIHTQDWDDTLLQRLDVPRACLPEVKDSGADFGTTADEVFGRPIPIAGVAGDQQAATVGQACFARGMLKSTYGTGCFAVLNTGATAVASENRLLTTVAYRLAGEVTYALEGSIFMAGAIVQWLRDEMGLIARAEDSEALAAKANPRSSAVLVPAFTGLGAPHWRPDVRAALFGLTRDTGKAEICRAALESVSLQTRDLMQAMADDMAREGLPAPNALRVDGGMVANDWFAQNLADLLALDVERPQITETTALGAALMAGLQIGFYDGLDAIAARWRLERGFSPIMSEAERDGRTARWQAAVSRLLAE